MEHTTSRWLGAAIAAVTLMLAACGGGGSNESSQQVAGTGTSTQGGGTSGGTSDGSGIASPQNTTAPPAPVNDGNPFNDPAPATGSALAKRDCGITNLGRDIVNLLNSTRARGASCGSRGSFNPAGPLGWNTQLEDAAIVHSQDMADNNLFSHVGSTGQTLAVRVDASGYQWQLLGENIAAGFDTPEETVRAWMASDGHCANVMNPQFQDIALACIDGTLSTRYRNYWTLDFGRPR